MSTFSVFVFSKEVCNAQPTYIKINLKQANTMSIFGFQTVKIVIVRANNYKSL